MHAHHEIGIELSAVIVSLTPDSTPQVVVTPQGGLPSGPLETQHTKLEQALRAWVQKQAATNLGYVEQLYTFADKDRGDNDKRIISIGYLALTRDALPETAPSVQTVGWYRFFPWEDHRFGAPQELMAEIHRRLQAWRKDAPDTATKKQRAARIAVHFPQDPKNWNEELVLQRYELLWEAGLLPESPTPSGPALPGLAMPHDHRRILATAMARLRAKIKYRAVVFELLPDQFTLLHLQNTVEALAGLRLHKQNFRRLIQNQGLVEQTTKQSQDNRGRPAKLFRFQRGIVMERAVTGTKLPRS